MEKTNKRSGVLAAIVCIEKIHSCELSKWLASGTLASVRSVHSAEYTGIQFNRIRTGELNACAKLVSYVVHITSTDRNSVSPCFEDYY